MFAIVTAVATEDPPATEAELERLGFRRQEVWIKHMLPERATDMETALRRLRVGQFLVSDYWGREPE